MPTEVSTGHTAKLNGREQVPEGTMALYFNKPNGFEFWAGQALDITLLSPRRPTPRETFAHSPWPVLRSKIAWWLQPECEIAPSSERSSVFRWAQPVKIDGPSGSLTLHKNSSKPAVFLAGGIGITPFLSIVRQAAKDKLPHRLHLFYSNRRPEDAPFLDTLTELQRAILIFALYPRWPK